MPGLRIRATNARVVIEHPDETKADFILLDPDRTYLFQDGKTYRMNQHQFYMKLHSWAPEQAPDSGYITRRAKKGVVRILHPTFGKGCIEVRYSNNTIHDDFTPDAGEEITRKSVLNLLIDWFGDPHG